MQFRIDVDKDWVVNITNLQTQALVVDSNGKAFERTLGKVGENLNLFPQPPDHEAQKIPNTADNPHFELCTTKDAAVIAAAYQKLLRREADEVVKFGRYLFATLLGDELWQTLNDVAKTEPIELALNWKKDDFHINRLPWEMMHSKDGFLAAEPEVAITRRVAGTKQTLARIAAPRVLFVVGSDLAKDDRIKPGAEYLGLLRSLKPTAKLRLKTHLLLQASPQRLKAAIKWFKPTVVHFICHGFPNPDQETFLQLMADNGGGTEAVNADNLLKLLKPDPTMELPQIVILNACYTAVDNVDLYMKSGQVASPMAVKLVAGDDQSPGVPIVLGMAGEVADQACRLFTRCFYQAILDGGEIAQAASAGRRLGILEVGLTDPKSSIDWALPTLFMSAGVTEPKLQIVTNPNEEEWHAVATQFAPRPDYPAFCDRLGLFEWYDCLMASKPDDLPTPQQHIGDLQLLAVSVDGKEKKDNVNEKLGRTWLLRQFASTASLDGHVPVLNSLEWIERDPGKYPTDLPQLIADFRTAMNITANEFKLTFSAETLDLVANDPTKLPAEFKNAFAEGKSWDSPPVMFAALRIDLLRLLEIARKKQEPPKPVGPVPAEAKEEEEEKRALPKLLLLVDDVHQMDKASKLLLQFFSSPYGLRSNTPSSEKGPNARDDIRVVCTYDMSLGLGEEATITAWLDKAKGAREVPLRAFQQPEDRLAYEFFLSQWKDVANNPKPLAVDRKAPAPIVEWFFDELKLTVNGIPSLLKSKDAFRVIGGNLRMPTPPGPVLRPMNDEDLIRLIPLMKRGM